MKNQPCDHPSFEGHIAVNRLVDIGRFAADISIVCAVCGLPFRFMGLPGGLSPDHPTISVDGTEARLPLMPAGSSRGSLVRYPDFTVHDQESPV